MTTCLLRRACSSGEAFVEVVVVLGDEVVGRRAIHHSLVVKRRRMRRQDRRMPACRARITVAEDVVVAEAIILMRGVACRICHSVAAAAFSRDLLG